METEGTLSNAWDQHLASEFTARSADEALGVMGELTSSGGRLAAASRLEADPPQPVARRGRLEREVLEPVQGSDRGAAPQLFLSHHLRLPDQS